MNDTLIVLGIIAALCGAFLLWLGIRSGKVQKALAGAGSALLGLFMVLLGKSEKKIRRQEAELEKKTAQLKQAEEAVQEVEDVQNEIRKAKAGIEEPATVPPAAAGDSAARLDRLNRL